MRFELKEQHAHDCRFWCRPDFEVRWPLAGTRELLFLLVLVLIRRRCARCAVGRARKRMAFGSGCKPCAAAAVLVPALNFPRAVSGMCADACHCCMCQCSGEDNTACTDLVDPDGAVGPGHYCCHPPEAQIDNATCTMHDSAGQAHRLTRFRTSCHPETCTTQQHAARFLGTLLVIVVVVVVCFSAKRVWRLKFPWRLRTRHQPPDCEETELVQAEKIDQARRQRELSIVDSDFN